MLGSHEVLRSALASGRLSWTKAREIVDVVTTETARDWVERACTRSRRTLHEEVQKAKAAARAARVGAAARPGKISRTGLAAPAVHTAPTIHTAPAVHAAQGALRGTEAPARARAAHLIGPADGAQESGGAAKGKRGVGAGNSTHGSPLASDPEPLPSALHRSVTLRLEPVAHAAFEALLAELRKAGARGTREELLIEGLEAALGIRLRDAALARAARRMHRGRAANGERHVRDSVHAENSPVPAGEQPVPQGCGATGEPPVFVAMRSPYQVFVRLCPCCDDAALATTGRDVAIDYETLVAMIEDADVIDTAHRRRATIPPKMRRAIYARDGFRCQAPGCGRRQQLSVHHADRVRAGGINSVENGVTMCLACHRALHATTDRSRELRHWRKSFAERIARPLGARGEDGSGIIRDACDAEVDVRKPPGAFPGAVVRSVFGFCTRVQRAGGPRVLQEHPGEARDKAGSERDPASRGRLRSYCDELAHAAAHSHDEHA